MPITKASGQAVAPAAKGDLVVGSATNDAAVLGVGSNDQVLTADSSTTTGLKWAAASAGGKNFSLLNSGGTSLSGSTTTVSGISGRDALMISVMDGGTNASGAGSIIGLRINGDSGSNYLWFGGRDSRNSTYAADNDTNYSSSSDTQIPLYQNGNTNGTGSAAIFIFGGNSSGVKIIQYIGASDGSVSGATPRNYRGWGVWTGSATISSISIVTSAGSFDVGTVRVYASA